MESLIEKIIDIFDILTGSGVRFYYGDDEIELREVLAIDSYEKGYIYFTLEDENKRKVLLDDFRTYHSKENINLYDWEDIRTFDRLLESLSEENKA